MARASQLTCRQAQDLMQKLLDRLWTQPIPKALQKHFQSCAQCASWAPLFDYEPQDEYPPLSSDFSQRVIRLNQQQHRPKTWLLRPSWLLSAAAAVLIIVLGSFFWAANSPPSHENQNSPQKQRPDLLPTLLAAQHEFEQIPDRFQRLRPASFSLLSAFPEVELQIPSDPLTGSLPDVKVLGNTLQGAIEPIETPVREAYQKVKMIIDDPAVRKWFDTVAKGAV